MPFGSGPWYGGEDAGTRGIKQRRGKMQSYFPLLTEDLFLKENWIKIQRAAFQPGTRESFITNWMEAHKKQMWRFIPSARRTSRTRF